MQIYCEQKIFKINTPGFYPKSFKEKGKYTERPSFGYAYSINIIYFKYSFHSDLSLVIFYFVYNTSNDDTTRMNVFHP